MPRKLLAGVAVSMLIVLGTPVAAPAAVAPNGLIALSALDENGVERIFTVQPDGTGRTNITAAQEGAQSAPVWSPDGSRILFNSSATDTSGYGTTADVWVMDADGSNPTILTATSNPNVNWYDNHPSWSPDGTEFVWGTNRDDGDDDIFRANIDGTNARPLIANEASFENEYGTFYPSQLYPAWSPDGSRIAFLENRWDGTRIALVDPDGTNQTYLDDPYAGLGQGYMDISWSPDGTRLLFLEHLGYVTWEVMVADLVTGEFFDITPAGYADFATPSFSPDGTQIIVSAWSFDAQQNGILSLPNPVSTAQPAAATLRSAATLAEPNATTTLTAAVAFLPGTSGALTSDWGTAAPAPTCTITGTESGDRLLGTAGDDVICGLGGNDIIDGRGGNDIVFAGTGNDIVGGGSGNDTLHGDDGNDAISGSTGNDTLAGGTGRDALVGGTGADTIAGGDDADILIGIDRVRGNDSLDGGAARDVCAADPGDTITSC